MARLGELKDGITVQKTIMAPIAVVLHADPHKGESMNSRIPYMMFHTFKKIGFSVLRFNFRGIGRSEGAFDQGEGELCDAAAALDWVQTQHSDKHHFWIGGVSFGAWIGMQLLMRRPEIKRFIAISPPAKFKDFSFLAPCPASGMIIHGGLDTISEEEDRSQKIITTLKCSKAYFYSL